MCTDYLSILSMTLVTDGSRVGGWAITGVFGMTSAIQSFGEVECNVQFLAVYMVPDSTPVDG